MTDKLVYIKNGGGHDVHCGELTKYSPIIYDENQGLSIDHSIEKYCAYFMKPEWCENLKADLKYLIRKDGSYGYIHNNVETYFPNFLSKHIVKELKDLSFEHSIIWLY
jgi:hypothetical protein